MYRKTKAVLLFSLLALGTITASAQKRPYDPMNDRSVQSNPVLRNYWRQKTDSLYNTDEYRALRDSARNASVRQRRYSGGSIFSGVIHSDVSTINTALTTSGFPALNEYSALIGFGWNARSGQVLTDFTLLANFGSRSKKESEKYTIGGGDLLRLDIGYDLLRSDKVALYPYAGLGWRISWIRYNFEDLTKPNLLIESARTPLELTARSSRVGYQAGLGLDLRIGQSKDGWRSTFLFFKGGINGAIGGEKYKVEGRGYHPPVQPYDWEVQAGFKFMRPR
ncbi:hypothetical protein EPD60_10110 [Flaviaesturariibacter flavus]|uniref:Outer membrane protein beta-barrel domain-containing protein n=1 Tax=Flaviaesturariibacter flavus TaxID=2502780 RepID=A0A4V2NVQ1_9BACT|nr:hypothetical protein [Flaviaesturariibacter flavus]TCJ14342.1 hypothetical protein EPD60_10110 [Flaviaesturariibacter flavus]